MAITLKKGQKLSLSKEGLTKATVGLGWLINQYDTGENADLDSSVFMLGEDGKVPSDAEFIYYNQPKHSSGAVIHNGDNKKGTEVAGKDAETIDIDLTKVPDNIKKIVITATIYDPEGKLNFGQVSNSFIRITNAETKTQVCRYDLEEVFSIGKPVEIGGMLWKVFNNILVPIDKSSMEIRYDLLCDSKSFINCSKSFINYSNF